jgi:subtilisin family serine protease
MRVLIEVRVPGKTDPATILSTAAGWNVASLVVDPDYDPVPLHSSPDRWHETQATGEKLFCIRGEIDDNQIATLEARPEVVKVYEDAAMGPHERAQGEDDDWFVDPQASGKACPIPPCDCDTRTAKGDLAVIARDIGVNYIWERGARGQGMVVGVVDSGIRARGRVGGGEMERVAAGWPDDWGTVSVAGGHGMMVATDLRGMAPECSLYDLRIADRQTGSMPISFALSAFEWAIQRRRQDGTPHVLTNSWGLPQERSAPDYARDPNHPFTRKVVEALNEGILVLFSAGNCGDTCADRRCGSDTGEGRSIWGANGHARVMTVGAANRLDQLIGYSSQGPAALDPNKPDFCGISHFRGWFPVDTGTSAACPVAAGVVTLLKQAIPQATQQQIKTALRETAKDIGPDGWDPHSGTGVIRARAAYDELRGCPPPPEPGPINRAPHLNIGFNLGWLQQGIADPKRSIQEMQADLDRILATAPEGGYIGLEGHVAMVRRFATGRDWPRMAVSLAALIGLCQGQVIDKFIEASSLALGIVFGWLQQAAAYGSAPLAGARAILGYIRLHAANACFTGYEGLVSAAERKINAGEPVAAIVPEINALFGLFGTQATEPIDP